MRAGYTPPPFTIRSPPRKGFRMTHATKRLAVPSEYRDQPLRACVALAVSRYFADLDGAAAEGLYSLVLKEVEEPLLETVMREVQGNQTHAAERLGISRGTLRKKLKQYRLD